MPGNMREDAFMSITTYPAIEHCLYACVCLCIVTAWFHSRITQPSVCRISSVDTTITTKMGGAWGRQTQLRRLSALPGRRRVYCDIGGANTDFQFIATFVGQSHKNIGLSRQAVRMQAGWCVCVNGDQWYVTQSHWWGHKSLGWVWPT